MNRRNFIGNVLTIGARFFILPGAGRVWVGDKQPPWLIPANLHYFGLWIERPWPMFITKIMPRDLIHGYFGDRLWTQPSMQ
jgi:hypothetical protein